MAVMETGSSCNRSQWRLESACRRMELCHCCIWKSFLFFQMNEEVNPNLEVAIKKKSPFITLGAETSKCHKREFLNEELVSEGEKYPLKILPARSQMGCPY
ncbi:unnamed protein product [Rangifer tarandus platyrhynchus]|uniref:Uncharacterized protein n=1 Tax=Rangifer tarandus platyrhynchus TaxID=3082113 RepID=A0AC59YBG4_RANTA